jgi:hypothetical protein
VSDLARTPASREARDRLLVVCDAAATERHYLRGLIDYLEEPAVTVRFKSKPCSPSQLVEYAIGERRRAHGDFDQVWCVFDVDDYDVERAVSHAGRSGVETAVSHPCFELWLLLHFRDHTAHAEGYRQLLPLLKKHVPRYRKEKLEFQDFHGGLGDAVVRARGMAVRGREHVVNPATGVWALVGRIAPSLMP